jgi:hypothetical protein
MRLGRQLRKLRRWLVLLSQLTRYPVSQKENPHAQELCPGYFERDDQEVIEKNGPTLHMVLLRSLWTTSKASQQGWRLGSIEPCGLSPDRKRLSWSVNSQVADNVQSLIFAQSVPAPSETPCCISCARSTDSSIATPEGTTRTFTCVCLASRCPAMRHAPR